MKRVRTLGPPIIRLANVCKRITEGVDRSLEKRRIELRKKITSQLFEKQP